MEKAKKPFYKRPWFVVICLLVVLAGIGNSCGGNTAEDPTAQASTQPTPAVTPSAAPSPSETPMAEPSPTPSVEPLPSETPVPLEIPATLGISADDFIDAFNENMAALESKLKLSSVEWSEENEGTQIITATGFINDYNVFTFSATPDTREIISIFYIGTGDGTYESGVDVLYCMSATIRSVDPSISSSDSIDMILTMMDETQNSTTKNNIAYSIFQSKDLGTWLTVDAQK